MEIIIKMDREEPEELRKEIKKLKDEYQKLRERYAQCEMDLYNRDHECQDLKLENDLLKQRDEIMLKFVKSACCDGMSCSKCLFLDDRRPLGKKCIYKGNDVFADISNAANDVLQELDNL